MRSRALMILLPRGLESGVSVTLRAAPASATRTRVASVWWREASSSLSSATIGSLLGDRNLQAGVERAAADGLTERR